MQASHLIHIQLTMPSQITLNENPTDRATDNHLVQEQCPTRSHYILKDDSEQTMSLSELNTELNTEHKKKI